MKTIQQDVKKMPGKNPRQNIQDVYANKNGLENFIKAVKASNCDGTFNEYREAAKKVLSAISDGQIFLISP